LKRMGCGAMGLSRSETWALVHAERARLIDDLAAAPPESWHTPSLCQGWTVHDTLAHLVDTAKTGKFAFVRGMIQARGDFDRANEAGVLRCRREDPEATLADFRRVLSMKMAPPAPLATRLAEAIVHGEDIRRPLRIESDYPLPGVHEALAYQLRTSASFGGSRERVAGCRLTDTDSGISWGEGAQVSGRAIDLLLAATGRRIAPELMSGEGAARLLAVA